MGKKSLQKHKKVEQKVVPRIAVIVTKRALDNHKKVLTFASMLKKNPINFQCNFCQKYFSSKFNLDDHYCKTIHEEDIISDEEDQNSEIFSKNEAKTREIAQNFTGNDTNEALIDPMSVVKVEMENGKKFVKLNFSNEKEAKTREISQNSENLSIESKTREITQNSEKSSIEAAKTRYEIVNSKIENSSLTKKQSVEKSNDAGTTSGGNENKQTDEKCKQTTNNKVSAEVEKTREIKTPEKGNNTATEDLKWTLSCVKCKQIIQVGNYESHLRNAHKIFNVKVQVKTKPAST